MRFYFDLTVQGLAAHQVLDIAKVVRMLVETAGGKAKFMYGIPNGDEFPFEIEVTGVDAKVAVTALEVIYVLVEAFSGIVAGGFLAEEIVTEAGDGQAEH